METIDLKRRRLMTSTAGVLAVTGFTATTGTTAFAQQATPPEGSTPLPAYVGAKDADALIIHSNNTIELKREAMGTSAITPETRLYVRNNVAPPAAEILDDRDAWSVSVEGVGEPRSITLGELKTLGVASVAMVLQCSGNGRAYFDHSPSGTPWQVGAAGCVIWTGVPLRTVVDAMGGAAEGARFVTGTGGETIPAGLDPLDIMVERSVPIAEVDTILLAWEMNGEPITLAHGGPLRMVVPGFTGVNSIKYVKTIALTEAETEAAIQKTRYRIHPLGTKGDPSYPSVWEMQPKSWITAPLGDRESGRIQITGLAFGGINALEKVEVSIDDGETWTDATFVGPDLGRYAWRPFVVSADLKPGQYTLVSRATDSEGNQQPRDFEPNEAGYSHNGWQGPAVSLTVS